MPKKKVNFKAPSKKTTTTVAAGGGGSSLIILFIAGIIFYFVYDQQLSGFLYGVLLTFLTGLVSLIGFIPIAGPFLYYDWIGKETYAWSASLTNLPNTWASNDIFLIGLVLSIVWTAAATIWLLATFWPKR